jgi:hypothetical protein
MRLEHTQVVPSADAMFDPTSEQVGDHRLPLQLQPSQLALKLPVVRF